MYLRNISIEIDSWRLAVAEKLYLPSGLLIHELAAQTRL